ncbi:hypothetical protein [Gimesia chilikensis]|uniref:Uncharacterized protein n=1 Tax=Gimesia chilikensis TaxID=2605989 RepID=A0A517PT47_9PLAN|nr:hypothetical protein [Gimesia chilikensis]QDT22533.1 hypothetical protein HG66A1_43410 [Gimesia chilikensis]
MTISLDQIRLQSLKPSEATLQVVKDYADQVYNTNTTTIRKGWKGVLGFKIGDFEFIGVQTTSKPPRRFLMVVERSTLNVFAPAESPEDFSSLCSNLCLESPDDVIRLYELCTLDYGAVDKNCFAIPIEIQDLGIDVQMSESGDLFWQKWGGKLYLVKCTSHEVMVNLLKSNYGDYIHLPVRLKK